MAGESGSVPRYLRWSLKFPSVRTDVTLTLFIFLQLTNFFKKISFYYCHLCVCVCLCGECHVYKSGLRSPKRAPDALELKLQEVVSFLLWVLRTKSQSCGRAARAHDH